MSCSCTCCYWERFQLNILLTSNCNRKSKSHLIIRTKLIIFFLSEQKQHLFSAAASANTSTTTDLNYLVHLNPIFSLVLFVIWVGNFTPNRELRIIRNAKHRIHSTTVYASILFPLAKIISKAKYLIYFHTVYTSVFSSVLIDV